MNTAEVIKREPHGISSLQVVPFLAESVGQSRQSAHSHPYTQILPFDMRRTDSFGVGVSPHRFNRGIHHLWWRVPMFFVGGSGKRFDKLPVVHPHSKASMDSVEVGLECVGGDLKLSRRGPFKFFGEGHCIAGATPSKVPSQNQFCVALHSDEAIGIPAHRVAVDVPALFAAHVSPYLIGLDIPHRQVMDSAFQEPFALVAHQDKQGKNCSVVNAREAFDRANAASLDQEPYCLGSLIQRGIHAAQRCGVVFSEGFAALLTAVTAKAVSVKSEFLAAGIAVMTGHFGLPFCGSKPIMRLRDSAYGLPRVLSLAPLSASTEGGAFFLPSFVQSRKSANNLPRFIIEISCLAAETLGFYKRSSRPAYSAQCCMKNGERLSIPAYVHTHSCKMLHYLWSGKSGSRLRHKNLAAKLREASRRSNALFICQRLKRSDRVFQLGNSLRHKLQFCFALLKFLLRREVACFERVNVDVCHNGEMILCRV